MACYMKTNSEISSRDELSIKLTTLTGNALNTGFFINFSERIQIVKAGGKPEIYRSIQERKFIAPHHKGRPKKLLISNFFK